MLFKFVACFAESRTHMTRYTERFQDGFAETKLAYKLSFVSAYHQLFRRCVCRVIDDTTARFRHVVNAMIAFCSALVYVLKTTSRKQCACYAYSSS